MAYLPLSIFLFTTIVLLIVFRKWHLDVLSPPWRIYYLFHGFKARHRTFCPTILQEEDDLKRLLYLIPYIAASFTPVILIVPKRTLLLASLSYVYWRILDTFDDLLIGEEREKGLRILSNRLQQLHQSGFADNDDEIEGFNFSIVGPRDEIYVNIVQTIARLDSIFLRIDKAHQDVLVRFVEHQMNDFLAVPHSHFKTEQQYHEKCVTTIMTGLYLATFEVNRSLYGFSMNQPTKNLLKDTCESFETGNVIKDLEKDFRQGISYHPELFPRGIIEEIRPDELEKIGEAREWLTYRGIQYLPSTCAMFENEWNETFLARFMALLLKTYLVNNYRKYWCKINRKPFKKMDTKRVFLGCLLKTLLDWKSAITKVDQRMLSWRPNVEPLWTNGGLMEK